MAFKFFSFKVLARVPKLELLYLIWYILKNYEWTQVKSNTFHALRAVNSHLTSLTLLIIIRVGNFIFSNIFIYPGFALTILIFSNVNRKLKTLLSFLTPNTASWFANALRTITSLIAITRT